MTSPIRVYVAGSYSRREELQVITGRLAMAGVHVTSRWLTEALDGLSLAACAVEDLEDIETADGILFFSDGPLNRSPGGRHVEFGYAIAKGKWLWIVGERENVFHHLSMVYTFADVEEWIAVMVEGE